MRIAAEFCQEVEPVKAVQRYPEDWQQRIEYEKEIYETHYRKDERIRCPFYYHHLGRELVFLRTLVRKFGIPQGAEVIDIGCGNGIYAGILSRLGMRVTGLDISPTAIEFCEKTYGDQARFICADVTAMDWNKRYDYAFCNFFTFFNSFDTPQQGSAYGRGLMEAVREKGMLFFIWYSDLTAVRLPPDRFHIMNFTPQQVKLLFPGFPRKVYAIDSRARLTAYLGEYALNKYVTRLSCALIRIFDSSWWRVRIILAVEKNTG